jgi:tyrosine-protein kinase Etk/Wzc
VTLPPTGHRLVPAERRVHLRDLFHVIAAHWRAVALVTVIVVGAAGWSARGKVTRYQASAVVQINSRKGVLPALDDRDVDELALRTDPVASEALILTTQTLALAVADALGLQLQVAEPGARRGDVIAAVRVDSLLPPDSFALASRGAAGWELRDGRGGLLASGAWTDSATGPGFTLALVPLEEPRTVRLAVLPRVTAGAMVRSGITYQVQPNTNIVTVTYTGADPTLVPLIVDEAVRAFGEYGAGQARLATANRLRYIAERLEDARVRYQDALRQVQRYEESQSTSDLSAEEVALINAIQELERDRQRRQVDLETIRSILDDSAVVSIEAVNRLAAIAAISSNTAMRFQLENLLKLYDERRTLIAGTMGLRENNPQVIALDQRIAAASAGLFDATTATVRGLETTLASVEQQVRGLRRQLAAFPGKRSQYQQLALDAELQNDTYRYLLSQWEAARIHAATIAPYVQIVERPGAAVPIGVAVRQKLVLATLVGLFLGALAAFLLEYLDQSIRSTGDVERALGVPLLGLVPYEDAMVVGGPHHRALPLVSLHSPDDPASEAYRALRTNVTFVRSGEQPVRSLVVTSPGPSEGKSTTAANLAITLAQQGARTLLVDADLRRPHVHRAFNLVQEPGLSDLLVGRVQLREAVRPGVAPNLDILPAGALPPNPSELLGSEAMRRLLAELHGRYDMVVCDSPPTLPVTDATVLGAAADGVILVIRSGETEEAAAQRALEQLQRLQVRVAGTVLNGVARRRDRYYNHYYYRYDRGANGGGLRRRLAKIL